MKTAILSMLLVLIVSCSNTEVEPRDSVNFEYTDSIECRYKWEYSNGHTSDKALIIRSGDTYLIKLGYVSTRGESQIIDLYLSNDEIIEAVIYGPEITIADKHKYKFSKYVNTTNQLLISFSVMYKDDLTNVEIWQNLQ